MNEYLISLKHTASIVGLNEVTIYMCIIIPQNDVDG